ncbi:MAG: hypothetical protein K2X81_24930 [Candidatus Obscuribacterales bacterium]|nr:hypothetical protein [Candidatus Obscuribacterales bacterium]
MDNNISTAKLEAIKLNHKTSASFKFHDEIQGAGSHKTAPRDSELNAAAFLFVNYSFFDIDANNRLTKGELQQVRKEFADAHQTGYERFARTIQKHFNQICNSVDDQKGREKAITFNDALQYFQNKLNA